MDTGLSRLLSALEAERRQWYAQQRALLDRVTALEGLIAEHSRDQLADELAVAKIAIFHLRENLLLLTQEVESLRRTTLALWDVVTPDSPPAAAALDFHCMD